MKWSSDEADAIPNTTQNGAELPGKPPEFARDVDRNCVLAFREYELFANVFRSMFAENPEPPEEMPFVTEEYPDGIPGIVLVKKTITVADVVRESDGLRIEIESSGETGS
jgi:hypothetical protein